MMDSTVVECVTVRGESPEAEAEAGVEVEAEAEAEGAAASDGASAGCEGQATPRSSPDTNSPVMISVEVRSLQITSRYAPIIAVLQEIGSASGSGSGSNGQRSDEEDFVKVDDLPLQLTVMCEVCV